MSDPLAGPGRTPEGGRPGAAGARPSVSAGPTILVVGVVAQIDGLVGLGRIERARWADVASCTTQAPVDLVVVGRSSSGVDARGAITRLKKDPDTAAIPLLHAGSDADSDDCPADLCLAREWTTARLRRAVGLLLELRQARRARPGRLEALGRLSGEIVHDFNNLLFVVAGHAGLARRQLPAGHPVLTRLSQVEEAVTRGADLTRQLLRFGRESIGPPPPLDLNAVVARVERLVQRVIGERLSVEARLGAGLGSVRVDAGQMEQVLLNLVLNARDAMPDGGRVTIETHDVEIANGSAPPVPPGRYAVLAVADEGTGMDAATRGRVFEPFFTTKPQGEGAGLGLALVHAIVERAGGTIAVDSEPGEGSTFRVYLPCSVAADEPGGALPEPAGRASGDETVLLVESHRPALEVATELLASLGYTVLPASTGEDALLVLRAHAGAIHLLLADLDLPGPGGQDLATRVAAERPGVRVLFMSARAEAVGAAPPEASGPVLQKPITSDRLVRAIREVLDQG